MHLTVTPALLRPMNLSQVFFFNILASFSIENHVAFSFRMIRWKMIHYYFGGSCINILGKSMLQNGLNKKEYNLNKAYIM